MGCSSSSIKTKHDNENRNQRNGNPEVSLCSMKEEHISLAFKAKRGNVFTPSIEPEIRRTFVAKCYPKSPEQEEIIRTYSYKYCCSYIPNDNSKFHFNIKM